MSVEYVKACPCFDVQEFLRTGRSMLFVLLVALVFPCLLSSCKSSGALRRQRIESDSVATVVRRTSLENSVQTSRSVWREGEEHIEQIVLVFREDTIEEELSKRHPPLASVTRTVVDRKYNTDARTAETLHTVAKDSVQEVRQQHFTKATTLPKPKWGGWVLLGVGVVGTGVFVLRRIR